MGKTIWTVTRNDSAWAGGHGNHLCGIYDSEELAVSKAEKYANKLKQLLQQKKGKDIEVIHLDHEDHLIPDHCFVLTVERWNGPWVLSTFDICKRTIKSEES